MKPDELSELREPREGGAFPLDHDVAKGAINDGGPVRLSAWVFFVEHGDHVAIHHALSGSQWMVDRAAADRLLTFAGFRSSEADLTAWVEAGVLVRPFQDPLIAPLHSAEEGRIAAAWNDWYWKREVEAEREYRWHGEVVLKMPDDLFLYQELIFGLGLRRILEIGSGRGGGLWFFATVLAMTGGEHVVGVEVDPPIRLPAFSRCPGVRVDLIKGDAHAASTVDAVQVICSEFDLVVLDADPTPTGKLALLERWLPLVAAKGVIVLEDVTSTNGQDQVILRDGLDELLLSHREFGVCPQARRFAMSKVSRGTFQRICH